MHLVVAGLCVLLGTPALGDARAALREQRAKVAQEAEADRSERAEAAEAVIRGLVEVAEQGQLSSAKADLYILLHGLRRLDAARLGGLPGRVGALPETGGDPAATAAWPAKLAAAREQLTRRPMELAERAMAIDLVRLGHAFVREVLSFDPDHKRIRRALGQVKVPDLAMRVDLAKRDRDGLPTVDVDAGWLSPFEAKLLEKGFVWDRRFGWVLAAKRDLYERGGVFDLQERRWTTLDEANRLHGQLRDPWRIQTAHLDLRGTAPLEQMAAVASDLEAFYAAVFAEYAPFFTDTRRVDAVRLAMGLAEHKPLVVWVYANREQYLQGSGAPAWSGGVWSPSRESSYFYGGTGETMLHEFTHQILEVFTGGNKSPAWLTEGIAEYTATATMGADGTVTFRGAGYYPALPLDQLLELRTQKAWHRYQEQRSGGPSSYAAAGSLVTFLMNAEEGRFRADFIDFLRDSYRGTSRGAELWDYLGISARELEERYHAWGRGQ